MTIKRESKILFLIIIASFNLSTRSQEGDNSYFMEMIKKISKKLQKSAADFVGNEEEIKDKFSFLNFCKKEETGDKKDDKKYFLKLEKKVENLSQEYGTLAMRTGSDFARKIVVFIQNKTNSVLNMPSSEDRIELDKIGAVSGGFTAIITAALKKRSSCVQKVILPVFSGCLVYSLVSTNKEIKEAIYKKIDVLKK